MRTYQHGIYNRANTVTESHGDCECAIRFESAATTFTINKEADYVSKELAELSSAEFRNNTDFTKSVLLEAFGSAIDYCTTRFALLRYYIYALVL